LQQDPVTERICILWQYSTDVHYLILKLQRLPRISWRPSWPHILLSSLRNRGHYSVCYLVRMNSVFGCCLIENPYVLMQCSPAHSKLLLFLEIIFRCFWRRTFTVFPCSFWSSSARITVQNFTEFSNKLHRPLPPAAREYSVFVDKATRPVIKNELKFKFKST